VSDDRSYRLHSSLRALLQAYLQSQAAKEWKSLCEDLVWPPVFERSWTEVVRLYDLGRAIASITSTDVLHVKSLDVQSWARFLQILEDAGPAWVVAVLYGASGAEYHHARGPEEPPNSQRPRSSSTCQWCARRVAERVSQMLEVWFVWPLCP
jgi:hypothetical protein